MKQTLTDADRESLRRKVDELCQELTRGTGDLYRIVVLDAVRRQAENDFNDAVLKALRSDTAAGEIAAALGVTRQAVEKRRARARQGLKNVAIVVSRRNRVHYGPDGAYGEVGGPGQYDADRGVYRIGEDVRELARYVIIAVDGTVRRVYQIDPDGWTDEGHPGYWEFHALGGGECTPAEIDAACAAGELPLRPGDDCPTRAGGAYRPYWF